jgi:hypothetical protein
MAVGDASSGLGAPDHRNLASRNPSNAITASALPTKRTRFARIGRELRISCAMRRQTSPREIVTGYHSVGRSISCIASEPRVSNGPEFTAWAAQPKRESPDSSSQPGDL